MGKMVEKAKIITLNENMAKVQVKRVSACGESCASCKGGCTPSYIYVDAINDIKAAMGQEVEIEMQTKVVLSAIVLNYGMPLLMLVIGIFSGSALADSLHLNVSKDLLGVSLGIVLMTLSYILTSQIDKSYRKTGKVEFIVKRIL
jgi:sigma-E factor negative regulatory protein RseC